MTRPTDPTIPTTAPNAIHQETDMSTILSTATTTIPAPATSRASTRTGVGDLRVVPAALRSEWIKLSTLRANKVMLGLTAGIGAVIAGALAATSTDPTLTAAELFIYPLPLVATLAMVTGILMFTSEVQHGSLAVTLAARPARWVTVVAKAVTAVGVGVAYGATAMSAGYGGAVAGGAAGGAVSELASRSAWALLYISLAALVGLGVGMIVRHSAGAVSGLLMWSFVIETLFAPALPDGVLHALPFSAGYRLLDAGPNFKPPVVIAHELSRPAYALIFGGFALTSMVVGTVLLYRRDSN